MKLAIPIRYLINSIATVTDNVAILRKMHIYEHCSCGASHVANLESPFKIRGGIRLLNTAYALVLNGKVITPLYQSLTEANEKAKSIKVAQDESLEIYKVYTTRHNDLYVRADVYRLGEELPWCQNCYSLVSTNDNTYLVFEGENQVNSELKLKGVNTDYDYVFYTFTHYVTSRTFNANITVKGDVEEFHRATACKIQSCMVSMVIAKAGNTFTVCRNTPPYYGTVQSWLCRIYKASIPLTQLNEVTVNDPSELNSNITDDEVI